MMRGQQIPQQMSLIGSLHLHNPHLRLDLIQANINPIVGDNGSLDPIPVTRPARGAKCCGQLDQAPSLELPQ
jgi:hypothetical protein